VGAIPPHSKTPDEIIASIAGRQHRVVARRQRRAAGVTRDAVRHRIRVGRLYEQHPGVFSVGTSELDRLARLMAAVLAAGEAAVVSHSSGAEHLGLLRPVAGPIHVTVPGTNGGERAGLVVHATRRLERSDWTRRHRIPVTTAERTLIDLAADPRIERMLEQAFALKLIGPTRMREALTHANGRPGTKNLRRLLRRLLEPSKLTRSELERLFLRVLAEAGLPMPLVNRHRASHRVDFVWPDHGLVVETDGRATHDNAYAFHEDRRRDLDLELSGLHVIRLSWWQIVEEPERVVCLLRTRLRAARSAR